MSNSNQNSNKIWIIDELTREKLEPLLESKSINKTDIYNITISALITSIKNTTDNVFQDPPIFTEHAGYTNLSNIKVDEKNQNYTSI